MKFDAIVLAGGEVAIDDPLFPESPEGHRSLIDIHGKPMLQWVIDALSASDSVDEIFVIGLKSEYPLMTTKPLSFLPDEGDIFSNIRSGVCHSSNRHSNPSKCFISSADIPALRSDMVDWLAGCVEENPIPHLYYSVIPQTLMEQQFPNAGRSYVRFKDGAVCGGDLNVIDSDFFTNERTIWKALTQARKHPLRQAALLGFDSLILAAFHMITLEKAVRKICKRLSLEGTALVSPYAEIGMDADKPQQLEILRRSLERRR